VSLSPSDQNLGTSGDDDSHSNQLVAVDVRPFFRSEYGTKSMGDGVHVEAGEGHGPRKEFFSLVGQQLCGPIAIVGCSAVGGGGTEAEQVARDVRESVSSGIMAFSAFGSEEEEEEEDGGYSDDSFESDSSGGSGQAPTVPPAPLTLFAYHPRLEALWFPPHDRQDVQPGAGGSRARTMYMAVGVLFAAAVAGGCTLGVKVPSLLLELIVQHRLLLAGTPPWAATVEEGDAHGAEAALEALEVYDPEIARAARRVLALPSADFTAMMELEDTDDEEDEQLPEDEEEGDGGAARKAWYVRRMATRAIIAPHRAALLAMSAGFSSGLPWGWLRTMQLSSVELATLLCGVEASGGVDGAERPDFSFQAVFRVELDEELLLACNAPLRAALWSVIETQLTAAERRALLCFVTGIDRVPASGVERLAISMPWSVSTVAAANVGEQKLQLQLLPQAHTCTNTLELPNYWQALVAVSAPQPPSPDMELRLEELLLERLRLAIAGAGGYGLDE
jgi:hypothetical protein